MDYSLAKPQKFVLEWDARFRVLTLHNAKGLQILNFKNRMIQCLVPILRPKMQNWGEERRFLILSTTGLGDTLWGTPAIRALRECYPANYIGIITSPLGMTLLQHNRHIDEIFVAKDPLTPSLFSLYRALKAKKITHVLNFHTSQRSILPLAALLGAQEIIGTYGINKGLDFLLTHPLDTRGMHEIQRRLHIVAQVGAHSPDSSMDLFLSPEDHRAAATFLDRIGSGRYQTKPSKMFDHSGRTYCTDCNFGRNGSPPSL